MVQKSEPLEAKMAVSNGILEELPLMGMLSDSPLNVL